MDLVRCRGPDVSVGPLPSPVPSVAFTDQSCGGRLVRHQLQAEQALARDSFGYPTIVSQTKVLEPANDLRYGPDASFGRGDWHAGSGPVLVHGAFCPIPAAITFEHENICHPENVNDCIKGYMMTGLRSYPRMHVAGLNMAGEVNALGWAGGSPSVGVWRRLGDARTHDHQADQ